MSRYLPLFCRNTWLFYVLVATLIYLFTRYVDTVFMLVKFSKSLKSLPHVENLQKMLEAGNKKLQANITEET